MRHLEGKRHKLPGDNGNFHKLTNFTKQTQNAQLGPPINQLKNSNCIRDPLSSSERGSRVKMAARARRAEPETEASACVLMTPTDSGFGVLELARGAFCEPVKVGLGPFYCRTHLARNLFEPSYWRQYFASKWNEKLDKVKIK